ncbi:hypothetical protein AT727_19105 [Desulfitobacterium hafniense]|uniref:FeS cluster biogenesis domain-containing protein n=1 Tax=Desulfitobacterium hafniense TaxID=49338 RepID=A0A0W1JMX0_DESHA|nr:hypothetical protein AT727_19105 [Desulfitobacterium hafniense]
MKIVLTDDAKQFILEKFHSHVTICSVLEGSCQCSSNTPIESHVPSVRGGSPDDSEYIPYVIDQITVHVDPRIRLRDESAPLNISCSGFWILRTLNVTNAQCAWPGEED